MELDLIDQLRRRFPSHPKLLLGAGDDAAVLSMADAKQCVVTVDMLMDHVDFEAAEVDARRIGHKALAVNLSDLAAMAARPLAGVIAAALPRRGGMELALRLYDGILPTAEKYGLAVAGGDTNSWDGPLVLSVTLIGEVTPRGPLRRGGAKPGDRLVATGRFGGSILGRHLDFEPRVNEALLLAERYTLHAGIDVSDGPSTDLAHLAHESRCGAILDLASVPIAPEAEQLAARDGRTALDHALSDGEDFELLLAVPPDEAERMVREQPLDVPLTILGEFIQEPGLWQRDPHGRVTPLLPRGYQHRLD